MLTKRSTVRWYDVLAGDGFTARAKKLLEHDREIVDRYAK